MTDRRAIQAADDMFSAAFGWRPGGSEPAQPEDTMTTTTHARARLLELNKLPKSALAQLHVQQGGQMGYATYLKWRKDELVNVILECEGLDPWP